MMFFDLCLTARPPDQGDLAGHILGGGRGKTRGASEERASDEREVFFMGGDVFFFSFWDESFAPRCILVRPMVNREIDLLDRLNYKSGMAYP